MNDLESYFYNNRGRLIDKWIHYFEIYDRHLSRYRNTDVHVVEFGVFKGGSLQMWKHYFGPHAHIYGVDINEECKQFEEEQVQIHIGDQENREFLRDLAQHIPRIDILIDDGGHTMKQQIATFEELYPLIAEDGIYIGEDLHTSYWPAYGGGLRKKGSFIEFSKRMIDRLNAWHYYERNPESLDRIAKTTYSLHYYDSVLVVEKRPISPPSRMQTGPETVTIPGFQKKKRSFLRRIASRVRKRFFPRR